MNGQALAALALLIFAPVAIALEGYKPVSNVNPCQTEFTQSKLFQAVCQKG
jgi:hypothetical protein